MDSFPAQEPTRFQAAYDFGKTPRIVIFKIGNKITKFDHFELIELIVQS